MIAEIERSWAITELAVKALEEIKSGIEWKWETYVDIAGDALEEIERRNTNA